MLSRVSDFPYITYKNSCHTLLFWTVKNRGFVELGAIKIRINKTTNYYQTQDFEIESWNSGSGSNEKVLFRVSDGKGLFYAAGELNIIAYF